MTWDIYRDIILTGSEWLRTQGSMISAGRITAPSALIAISKSLQVPHALKADKNDPSVNISDNDSRIDVEEKDPSRSAVAALS